MLTIRTPYGEVYKIHDNGDIQRQNVEHTVSGKWKLIGIRKVVGGPITPLASITKEWLATHELLYKNGNPRYTGVDLDHGTHREWGNTKHHGIKSITID